MLCHDIPCLFALEIKTLILASSKNTIIKLVSVAEEAGLIGHPEDRFTRVED